LLKERLYFLWLLGCFVFKGCAEMLAEIKPCFSKVAAALPACNEAWYGSRLFLLKERLYFFVISRLFCDERPRWNKAAFFESRCGFVVRAQQSHCGFQKLRFYFSTVNPQKMTGRSQKWSCPRTLLAVGRWGMAVTYKIIIF
jgi:hypothetical protein